MRTLMLALAALALAASPAPAADARQQERDKKTVALNQKDFDAAAKYLGPRYTQHNPNAADGPEGLRAFLGFLKEKFPDSRSEIK